MNCIHLKQIIPAIKRKKIVVAAVVLTILLSVSAVLFLNSRREAKPEDRLLPVTMRVIPTTGGWGYEIFVDGKIFIKQETVPAVEGYRSFTRKDQATAVGNLAVKKIVKGQIPSITLPELKSLGVVE